MDNEVFIKQELVDLIHENHGLSKSDCLKVIDKVFETIIATIGTGETVQITGFGTFKVIQRKARKIKDIHTGDLRTLEPKFQVKFIPSNQLKQKINEYP